MPALTRRRVLAGSAVIAAGVAGAVAGLLRPVARRGRDVARPTTTAPPAPPAALVGALAREEQLIARLIASAGVAASAPLAVLETDHRAHREAVLSLLAPYREGAAASSATSGPAATPAPTSTAAVPPATVAVLGSHEAAAARAATAASAALAGTAASVLASIAACEAGHAALLSSVG